MSAFPQLGNYSVSLTVFAIAAVWFLYQLFLGATNGLKHLPGPAYSTFTKLRLKWVTVRGRRWEYIHQLHTQYGPVVRVTPEEISVTTAAAVKELYRMGSSYRKTAFYESFDRPGEPPSLFSVQDPKAHNSYRRLLANEFADKSVKRMETYISRNTRLAIQRMSEEMQIKGHTDVFQWFLFMATDVIGEAAFGESFNMLESGQKNAYSNDLEFIGELTLIRTELPWLIPILAPLGLGKRLSQMDTRLTSYAKESLQRYHKTLRNDPHNVKHTLLTKEFGLVEDGTLPEKQLVIDALGSIVAGTDTTANTATSAIYLIAQHPTVQSALIAEISTLPHDFTDEQSRNLPLLRRVLNETFRLRPVIGQCLPRYVPTMGATFSDYFIPSGTIIGVPTYSMHRDPGIFPQPDKFDPTRWETPTQEMKDVLVPFGGGSRICIGMHFAMVELRYALCAFFRTFTNGVEVAEGAQGFESEKEMRPTQAFLASPAGKRCLIRARV